MTPATIARRRRVLCCTLAVLVALGRGAVARAAVGTTETVASAPARSYSPRYVAFFFAASSGVSRGSKLTVTSSNSRPGSNVSVRSARTRPFSTSVQSIGHW